MRRISGPESVQYQELSGKFPECREYVLLHWVTAVPESRGGVRLALALCACAIGAAACGREVVSIAGSIASWKHTKCEEHEMVFSGVSSDESRDFFTMQVCL